MDYATARSEVTTKRFAGTIVLAVATLFVLAGLLLFLYSSLDGGGPALSSLSAALKRLVHSIFERTQYLLPIWNNAPVPNPNALISVGTLGFLACYIAVFVGASLIRSGNQLARRLRAIDRQIENKAIRESIKGVHRRSRTEMKQQINVPEQCIWKEAHTLYVAPLVVGIILWLIGKAFG
jgi:hypothetical protein